MESSNENLKATLLNIEDQTPQHTTRSTRNKKTLIFTSLILFTLIAAAGILLLVQNRTARSKSFDAYSKGSSKFYCHLTMYPRLCFTTMFPILNRSSLIWTPSPIFSASLQIAIAELKNTTNSISKAVLSISNDSPTRSTFHKCSSLLTDSLSRLNNSLATLTVDLDIEALTYTEADNIRAWNMAAVAGAEDCFFALKDIESRVEIEQEKIAVNEVKFKVDKARMCAANWMGLFVSRDFILYEFYNPIAIIESDYYFPRYYGFDYGFILFLYSALYLFLLVLYVLVLRGD